MKKNVRKLKRRSVKKRTISGPSFSLSRLVIITACILLVVTTLVMNRRSLPQTVLGASIVKPLYTQAHVSWSPTPGAVSYNIYYKPQTETTFIHAVRHLPADSTAYTITFLKKGVTYDYKISAADASGKEFWWSTVNTMNAVE